MNRRLIHVSVLVDDYDEAIAFYTQKLDFELGVSDRYPPSSGIAD